MLTVPRKFQYISLIRFGSSTYTRAQSLQVRLDKATKKYEQSKNQIKRLTSQCAADQDRLKETSVHLDELNDLRRNAAVANERVIELQKAEKELKTWKDRQPRIFYYLGVFNDIVEENTRLKDEIDRLKRAWEAGSQASAQVPKLDGMAYHRSTENLFSPPEEAQEPSRFDTGTSRTLSGWTSRVQDVPRNTRDLREESTESHILMPPPPRPASGTQKSQTRSLLSSDISHSFEAAPETAKRAKIISGQSLLESNVVLCDDGTWSLAKDASAFLKEGQQQQRRPYKHDFNTPEKEFGNSTKHEQSGVSHAFHFEAFPRAPVDHHSQYVSGNLETCTGQEGAQAQITTHETHQNTWLPQQFPPRHRAHGSGSLQSTETLVPGSMHMQLPAYEADSTVSRRQQTMNLAGARSEPIKNHTRMSPPKRQAARTLPASSPPKRRIVESNSAASPFFAPRSASQHVGRVSLLPNRIRSSDQSHVERRAPNAPFKAPTPSLSPRKGSSRVALYPKTGFQGESRPTLRAPSSSRDAHGFFVRPKEDGHETSQYFGAPLKSTQQDPHVQMPKASWNSPDMSNEMRAGQSHIWNSPSKSMTGRTDGSGYMDPLRYRQYRREHGDRHLGDYLKENMA